MTRLMRYWLLRGFLFLVPFSLMTACAGKPPVVIASKPADPIIAKVLVPVPCVVAQVPKSEDPAARARKGDDIFTLAKIAAAGWRVLLGENAELRAANSDPCPLK